MRSVQTSDRASEQTNERPVHSLIKLTPYSVTSVNLEPVMLVSSIVRWTRIVFFIIIIQLWTVFKYIIPISELDVLKEYMWSAETVSSH